MHDYKMEFLCYRIQSEFFPRFDYAMERSLKLQSRYYVLVRKTMKKTLQKKQYVTVYLCRKKDEAEFPVGIDDIIDRNHPTQNVEPGLEFSSRNINHFLSCQIDGKTDISLMIIDSKAKQDINKLRPTNIIVLAKDDDDAEEIKREVKGRGKLSITVATKRDIPNKINNLLEQIALSPLKKMCEECSDMLKKKISSVETSCSSAEINTSKMPHIEENNRKIKYRNLQKQTVSSNQDYCLLQTSPSDPHQLLNGQTFRNTDKTSGFKHAPASGSQQNGYVELQNGESPGTSALKANKYTAKDGTSSQKSMARVITTRFQIKRQRMHNGLKDNVPSSIALGSTITKSLVRQRPVEADLEIAYEGKRRKVQLSDQIDVLDTGQQQSSDKCQQEEDPERLLEAILCLYGMSNVPETEKPDVPKHSFKINKEMRNDLFKISSTVKRMGYRYRTFYIYAVKPKSETDERRRNNKISSVLKKYGIDRYVIAPCADQITELKHVGAKIQARSPTYISLRSRNVCRSEVEKGGTLGCFANMIDTEDQCGLLSKHVTEGCTDIYYHVGNVNNKIGSMLPETNQHRHGSLDISAARMDERICGSGTYFKDTKNNHLKGILHDYKEQELDEDKICRCGQPVHIYGAISNPGKGEITMPSVEAGLSSTLIQIEDQVCGDGTAKCHFAEKGDSGAIVCVEDPERRNIHALSMVMGTDNTEGTTNCQQTYLTLPLSKGLNQLENDTGQRLELC